MTDAHDPWTARGPGGDNFAPFPGKRDAPERGTEDGAGASGTVAAGELRAFIERIEALTEERKELADDLKEVYAELGGRGFDKKAVRTIVKLRAMDTAERHEWESLVDLYKAALGLS